MHGLPTREDFRSCYAFMIVTLLVFRGETGMKEMEK
jgi:hypothetical protein